jgi:hypothetical protein
MRWRDGFGSEWLRETYPDTLYDATALLTDIGGPEGAVFVVAGVYWLVDRERGARLAAAVIAGMSFIFLVKHGFGLPRPGETGGDGFPSGHAFTAVVLYAGLVRVFGRSRDPPAVLGATAVVAFVALSRVVLGQHFLSDVVVGAALGLAFLLAVERIEDLRVVFGFGAVLALVFAVVSGFGGDGASALGIALGGAASSLALDRVPAVGPVRDRLLLAVGGLGFVVLVVLAAETLADGSGAVTGALSVVLYAGLVCGIFFGPLVADEVRSWSRRESVR